jgi:hypothetical protein
MRQKTVMWDFINLVMPQDMGNSQTKTRKDVLTWFLDYGEITQMLDQLNSMNHVIKEPVRLP